MTQSKGAVGAFIVFVPVLGVCVVFGKMLRAHRRGVCTGLLVLAAGAAVLMTIYGMRHGRLPGGNSMLVRWQYWTASAEMAKEHPVFGTGGGNFATLYMKYKNPAARGDGQRSAQLGIGAALQVRGARSGGDGGSDGAAGCKDACVGNRKSGVGRQKGTSQLRGEVFLDCDIGRGDGGDAGGSAGDDATGRAGGIVNGTVGGVFASGGDSGGSDCTGVWFAPVCRGE